MLPDYEVLLLRDALIIIFPSQVLQQLCEAPNVPSSHQLIRSLRKKDEQDEAKPTGSEAGQGAGCSKASWLSCTWRREDSWSPTYTETRQQIIIWQLLKPRLRSISKFTPPHALTSSCYVA